MFTRLLRISMILGVMGSFIITPSTIAQEEVECDIADLMLHQVEHGMELADFPQMAQTDLDQALEALYRTGIAYQALAVGCGFDRLHAVEEEHLAEHGEADAHEDEHVAAAQAEDDHEADEHANEEVEAAIAAALAAGDPENGEMLFNMLQPATGFACATCHRVDTMERLVGPGLMGIGDPAHDPSEHMMMEGAEGEDGQADDDHAEADEHGEAGEHEDDDSSMMGGDMPMMDDDEMAAMMAGRGDNPVEYIRTSILKPSAFVVPGFPDDLMPKVYGEIFSEQEIDDLIAYLLTL